jgi:hypothetical protein
MDVSIDEDPVIHEFDIFSAPSVRRLITSKATHSTDSDVEEKTGAFGTTKATSIGQNIATPKVLFNSFPLKPNECSIVWKYLCDWVQIQVSHPLSMVHQTI